MNYAQLAFTDAIKKMQEEVGSRSAYDRMEKMSVVDGLTDNEINFIGDRDSFYMASFGENEYPYIQHRGGPAGFIKVIDNKTIGIVDFSGNRQYISTGNISKNEKVALILLSYPQRARLKIYANAKIVDLEENEELYNLLKPADYKFKPERMMIFEIQAYDWNCPQHITPRYTTEEIEEALLPQREYIKNLENKIKELESKLSGK
ncbi:pyridoxamine 5'-phosphate oxidase family protein [Flavobacterium sp. MMLR14_040]|uniref:pyridoxamine 5'-phosphate oxidase family protein n=1 Tax=Flavobacterium sp. MMLR14_040 TaxID=3093843 RepID=UPI00298FD500|nr:pyridoxamine 5'-phosphate oxidase family protein [Flavobacterium sp. MMLR14_040]MDW8851884.1 pyridoxamine 5'-phosphate oxidase family protein [Flavobacterium sp. MMLR14_040]